MIVQKLRLEDLSKGTKASNYASNAHVLVEFGLRVLRGLLRLHAINLEDETQNSACSTMEGRKGGREEGREEGRGCGRKEGRKEGRGGGKGGRRFQCWWGFEDLLL